MFTQALFDALVRRRRWKGKHGELLVSHLPALRESLDGQADSLTAASVKGEQSNTSVTFGDKVIMKLFRRRGAGHQSRFGNRPVSGPANRIHEHAAAVGSD